MEPVEFEFRPYRRSFQTPIRTAHGLWSHREGILLRLTQSTGAQSYGEIAPIPWFGSETLEQALRYCQDLPRQINPTHIDQIPRVLRATRFGLESAGSDLLNRGTACDQSQPLSICGLLPTGDRALADWRVLWEQGYRTFKWKIGVSEIERELGIGRELMQEIPTLAQIRLDANGGLTLGQAHTWLQSCDPDRIEFIEQPFPPQSWSDLFCLSQAGYPVPLALDESVATLDHLEHCYAMGWRGIYVIKPGIIGSPQRLRQWLQEHPIDLVFSSVLETPIGAFHAVQLLRDLSMTERAVGFGVDQVFAAHPSWPNPCLDPPAQVRARLVQIWDSL